MNLEIPVYLSISQDERRQAWRGRRLTKPRTDSTQVTRNEDASTRAFRRLIEKQEAEKKAMKYKLLRERYGKK